jgi:hypothetical protein
MAIQMGIKSSDIFKDLLDKWRTIWRSIELIEKTVKNIMKNDDAFNKRAESY